MDATTARKYSTRRRSIVGAIADKLNESLDTLEKSNQEPKEKDEKKNKK